MVRLRRAAHGSRIHQEPCYIFLSTRLTGSPGFPKGSLISDVTRCSQNTRGLLGFPLAGLSGFEGARRSTKQEIAVGCSLYSKAQTTIHPVVIHEIVAVGSAARELDLSRIFDLLFGPSTRSLTV